MARLSRNVNSLLYIVRRNLWRVNVRKYFSDVDSIRIDRPIFLLGVQGAGLTLISRMLRRHPLAVCCTGNNTYWNGADEMHNVMASCLPDELRLSHHSIMGKQPTRGSWLYATNEYLPCFRLKRQDASPSVEKQFKKVIAELLCFYANNPNIARFIDKSQSYTVKVDFLNDILAEEAPYFILVIRNPYAMCKRAVSNSYDWMDNSYEDKMRLAAEHWANSYSCALEDGKQTNNMITARFEDFACDPEAEIRRICGFIDLDFTNDMLPTANDRLPAGGSKDTKWYPVRQNINEAYLKLLTDLDVEIIDESCGCLAQRFGYSPKS